MGLNLDVLDQGNDNINSAKFAQYHTHEKGNLPKSKVERKKGRKKGRKKDRKKENAFYWFAWATVTKY